MAPDNEPVLNLQRVLEWTLSYVAVPLAIVGVGVRGAVPDVLPDDWWTQQISRFGDAGAGIVWLVLGVRIITALADLYGPSTDYLRETSPFKIMAELVASYALAVYLFGLLFLSIYKADPNAFVLNNGLSFNFVTAEYYSVVTVTSTGYGDVTPKNQLAMLAAAGEMLFGYFYTVLFFSVLAGLAGRSRQ